MGAWPLKPKIRVNMYAGSFNTRGSVDAEWEAFAELCKASETLMVDMSKAPFFGEVQNKNLPETASLATWCLKSFGKKRE